MDSAMGIIPQQALQSQSGRVGPGVSQEVFPSFLRSIRAQATAGSLQRDAVQVPCKAADVAGDHPDWEARSAKM